MTASGCPDENLVARLADGAVTDAERAVIEAHLDDCPACSLAVSELGGIVAALPAPRGYRLLEATEPGRWLADAADGTRVVLHVVGGTAGQRDRVLRAAQAVIRIAPANITRVIEAVPADDTVVIASAISTGVTARTYREHQRSRPEIIEMWRAAIAAVAALHREGIVHDGLSPDAVRVDHGVIEVGAFAAPVDEPAYRAPELGRGAMPSVLSDQFALCTAMWEGLTGRRPYAGATAGALAVTMRSPLELPPGDDRALFAILRRGLAPDPANRWPDLTSLLRALDRPASRSKRTAITLVVAAVIAAVATIGVMLAK